MASVKEQSGGAQSNLSSRRSYRNFWLCILHLVKANMETNETNSRATTVSRKLPSTQRFPTKPARSLGRVSGQPTCDPPRLSFALVVPWTPFPPTFICSASSKVPEQILVVYAFDPRPSDAEMSMNHHLPKRKARPSSFQDSALLSTADEGPQLVRRQSYGISYDFASRLQAQHTSVCCE